ncbi:MAG: lipoyl(octanoyl) transferase [Planctomycetia bacterium]|nr:lipoyl(octanoyl) transferase [Planctomycetia bacterium]
MDDQRPIMNAPEPKSTGAPNGALEVYLLGLVDFDAAIALQERLMREVAGYDDGRGALLVCEHPPLITVGREGSRAELRCSQEELLARQIAVRWLNRGGGSVVHAPGQLALYPILPVARRGWGLSALRERLELALVDLCRETHVRAWRVPEAAGVFCRTGQVAHLGVAIRSSISSHGLFVNVSPRMDALSLVRSQFGRATSLATARGQTVSMPAVRECLIRRLAAHLDYERYHLYTGHPLLVRTKRVVAYA